MTSQSGSIIPIFALYKKKRIEASLNKDTGEVEYESVLFKNPTAASLSAVTKNGAGRHVTQNGWKFWKYRDESGDVKPISELRKM